MAQIKASARRIAKIIHGITRSWCFISHFINRLIDSPVLRDRRIVRTASYKHSYAIVTLTFTTG